MSMASTVKNALGLVLKGEWREFVFRMRVRLGQVDLKTPSPGDPEYSEEEGYHYADSGGLHLEKVLKSLDIKPGDAIVDFGSGKGGVLFTLSKFPFTKITGCEVSPVLAEIARRNLEIMKVSNVNIVVADAREFSALHEYNYFYFFNPFPAEVMIVVMKNISASLDKRPRKATLIYFNPECHDAIVRNSPFRKVDEHPLGRLKYFIYSNC